MKLLTLIFTFFAAGRLSSGQTPVAPFCNNNYPGYPAPIYQQGSQLTQPGQPNYNYQPYVPGVPVNIQQLGTQTPIQQPGQPPFNYQPGVSGTNIQQLTQSGYTQPALQGSTIGTGIPINTVPQGSPIGIGIPINTVPQGSYPVNQQFIPQIGYPVASGPIKFPQ